MKKYLILVVAMLLATLTATTAQRKTVTDKLQVTGVKNAEILSTDSKGNVVVGTLPEIPEGKSAETIYKETWVDDSEIFDRTDNIVQSGGDVGMKYVALILNTTYLFDGDTYLYPERSIYLKTSRNCVLKTPGVENGDTPITANEWVDIMPYLQGNYMFYGSGNSIINALKTMDPFPIYLTFDSIEDMNIEVAVMTKNEGITSIAKKIKHINSVITEVPKKASKAELNNFILTVSPKLDKIDKLATDVAGNTTHITNLQNSLGTEVARLEGLVNNTGKVKTVNNIAPDANGNVTIPGGTSSGLEKITQNGKTGWRLAGVDATNYVDIGENAVDLSTSVSSYPKLGASGAYSFASGVNTAASGAYSFASGYSTTAKSIAEFAIGRFNTEYTTKNNNTDRAFVIGNGTDGYSRSDALIVYKNGNMDLNGLLKLKPISAPTTPEKGMIYFDSTDNKLKCYDGTVWQNLW